MKNGDITDVAISVEPLGKVAINGAAKMSYSAAGGVKRQCDADNTNCQSNLDQTITQLDQVLHKRLFSASQLVNFFLGFVFIVGHGVRVDYSKRLRWEW